MKSINTGKEAGNWPEAILGIDGEGLSVIDRLAAKRFDTEALAEEAAAYVLEKLSDNNWKRCENFAGNSQAKTWLISLTNNLLVDFSRYKFGRLRAPKWVHDEGKIWVDLWTALCKERRPLAEIVLRYDQSGVVNSTWVKQTAKIIKARIPNCGQKVFEATSVADMSSLENQMHDDEEYTETGMSGSAREQFGNISDFKKYIDNTDPSVATFEEDNISTAFALAEQNSSKLSHLRQLLVMSDEERILFRMIYQEGMSVSKVAKAMSMPRHHASAIRDNCLSRIREAIALSDLDLNVLLEQL